MPCNCCCIICYHNESISVVAIFRKGLKIIGQLFFVLFVAIAKLNAELYRIGVVENYMTPKCKNQSRDSPCVIFYILHFVSHYFV